MKSPDASDLREFRTPEQFGRWLEKHHAVAVEIWIRMFRKDSGLESIDWDGALDEALCWGWIDGIRKKLDDVSFIQRFTPRRAKSSWSQRNREHIERLTREGRMRAPGLAEVERAKSDGRWDAAYPPQSEIEVPADFLEALGKRPKARAFFETLNRTNHFAVVYRLHGAKRPETRARRIAKFVDMFERGEKLV